MAIQPGPEPPRLGEILVSKRIVESRAVSSGLSKRVHAFL